MTAEHEANIIKKLKLFNTTKEDHNIQTNKNKDDHDSHYVQFKIVHDALLKKTQDETSRDTMKILGISEASKSALHGKLESTTSKQFITEKGFEALREK